MSVALMPIHLHPKSAHTCMHTHTPAHAHYSSMTMYIHSMTKFCFQVILQQIHCTSFIAGKELMTHMDQGYWCNFILPRFTYSPVAMLTVTQVFDEAVYYHFDTLWGRYTYMCTSRKVIELMNQIIPTVRMHYSLLHAEPEFLSGHYLTIKQTR